MSEAKGPERAAVRECSRCGAFGPVRSWTFGYGVKSRIDQRSGKDIDGHVGTETVSLCAVCQRRFFWAVIQRFSRQQAHALVFGVIVVSTSFLFHGWFPELLLDHRVLLPLIVGAVYSAYFAFMVSRGHAPTMRKLCLELQRRELAAKANLPGAALVDYPPR